VLRLLRNDLPEPAPDRSADAPASFGLEGFESETLTAGPPAAPRGNRASWVIALLSLTVLVQAVPTALWARDYLAAATTQPPVASLEPAPPATTASTLTAAAPCEVTGATASESDAVLPGAGANGGDGAGVTPPAAPIAAGLVAVVAPFPLQIYARGRLVGTSEAETVMLPLGAHDLELANEAIGYRVRRPVVVQAGRRAMVRIDAPSGTLHVNATPWAEVWVDDQRAGETPIGNLQVPVGSRELVFRHPDLGERRARVLVTLKEPARISVDMRKP
jgi:hypothetical protein